MGPLLGSEHRDAAHRSAATACCQCLWVVRPSLVQRPSKSTTLTRAYRPLQHLSVLAHFFEKNHTNLLSPGRN